MTRKVVTFEANGAQHSVAFTTNAMARYQEDLGESIIVALNNVESNGFDVVRLRNVFRYVLQGEYSADETGDLMDEIGLKGCADKLAEAANLAFPKEVQAEPGK